MEYHPICIKKDEIYHLGGKKHIEIIEDDAVIIKIEGYHVPMKFAVINPHWTTMCKNTRSVISEVPKTHTIDRNLFMKTNGAHQKLKRGGSQDFQHIMYLPNTPFMGKSMIIYGDDNIALVEGGLLFKFRKLTKVATQLKNKIKKLKCEVCLGKCLYNFDKYGCAFNSNLMAFLNKHNNRFCLSCIKKERVNIEDIVFCGAYGQVWSRYGDPIAVQKIYEKAYKSSCGDIFIEHDRTFSKTWDFGEGQTYVYKNII